MNNLTHDGSLSGPDNVPGKTATFVQRRSNEQARIFSSKMFVSWMHHKGTSASDLFNNSCPGRTENRSLNFA